MQSLILAFQIEAQETSTTDQFFSTAVVTINVINENENFPIFAETTYQFLVPENQSPRPLTSSVPAGLTAITVNTAISYTYFHSDRNSIPIIGY